MRTHVFHDYNIVFLKARYQLFSHIFTKSLCSCSTLARSIYQTSVKPDGWQNSCSSRRVDRDSIHGTFPMYCMCIVSCEVCINTAFIEIYLMFCICTRYSFYPLTAFSLHIGDDPVLLRAKIFSYKYNLALSENA